LKYIIKIKNIKSVIILLELDMSKWVSTRESTRVTTGSSWIGLRKIQLFQKWVELNPAHLTHVLNGFEPG